MRGFNRAIIAGNLARDPELRYTVNKRAYARFTVAVGYSYKDNNGEFKEGTDFITVVAWGAIAETCGKYLKKGSPVLVEGRIRTGSYDAKDGSGKRFTTEIYLDTLNMLGSNQRGGNDFGGGGNYASRGSSQDFGGASQYVPSDDDFGGNIQGGGFGEGYSQDFENKSEENTGIPF